MARGLPFTYGPSRTALESSTARAMGVIRVSVKHSCHSSLVFDSTVISLLPMSSQSLQVEVKVTELGDQWDELAVQTERKLALLREAKILHQYNCLYQDMVHISLFLMNIKLSFGMSHEVQDVLNI